MDTKDKILQSALKLFVEKGFNVSTSAITKDAGVSAGILFHYFPTKNDLIIDLYTKILLDYHKDTTIPASNFKANEAERYRTLIKAGWDVLVDWGLDNWQGFQYMQLFESSVLADQFKIEENHTIQELANLSLAMTQNGIEYGYLKDLPAQFMIIIITSLATTTTKYLHENLELRYDEVFMEQAWQITWQALAR